MSNQNHSEESSQLIKKISGLDFVRSAEINSVTNISCRNFTSTLAYHKNSGWYIANISRCGRNYKVLIEVEGNKPNPKYEKKLKKVF